ncbi:MAG: hypothetical protein ACJ76I_06000, partial [Gaiellaceae bacterium]
MTGLTRFLKLSRRAATLVAAVAVFAALPAVASAASCSFDGTFAQANDPSLVDPAGNSWDLDSDGEVDDGYNDAANRSDAFDTFAE